MKTLWRWRCKMEIPMMEGEDVDLFQEAFHKGMSVVDSPGP